MVMLGQRWGRALKNLAGLYIDINTHSYTCMNTYKQTCRCTSKHIHECRHKDKQIHKIIVHTHNRKKQRQPFVQICTQTHTHTQMHWWVCSHYSLLCQRCSCPAGLSPDPQHWSQTGRTVFYISQGALQAHNTPLMLWSLSQVWST